MVSKIILGLSTGVIILVAAGWLILASRHNCPNFNQSSVVINNDNQKTILVAVANQPEQQAKGLSQCPSMKDTQGMLFLFTTPKVVAFWMKDMLIPLDIIWLRDHVVVGLVSQVMPPSPGTPSANLPQYRPSQSVDAVLEINAGQAATLGITTGSTVSY